MTGRFKRVRTCLRRPAGASRRLFRIVGVEQNLATDARLTVIGHTIAWREIAHFNKYGRRNWIQNGDVASGRSVDIDCRGGQRHSLGSSVVLSRGTEEVGLDRTPLWCDAFEFQAAPEQETEGVRPSAGGAT